MPHLMHLKSRLVINVVIQDTRMRNRFIILLTMAVAICGCGKSSATFEDPDYEIDSTGHNITFTLDYPVEAYWINDNGNGKAYEGTPGPEGKSLDCKGDWFSSSVSLDSPKEIVLTIGENTSGKDRQMTISAYHMGKKASMVITQK